MLRPIIYSLLLIPLLAFAEIEGQHVQPGNYYPQVKFETTLGDFVVELNRGRAKLTVNNFLTYVAKGEYDDTLIHRVEKEFVVQGGSITTDYREKKSLAPIFNESGNGLKNSRGTIAMARTNNPHSATRQFYFNLSDNSNLDPGRRWGYTVFGHVVEGEEILDKMGQVAIAFNSKTGYSTMPKTPLIIKRVYVVEIKK